jgi:hypothetical protein
MQSNQCGSNEPVLQDPVSLAIERSKVTGEEFCAGCGKGMGFPITAHVDDPRRSQGGARYSAFGFGQRCGDCPLPFDEVIG